MFNQSDIKKTIRNPRHKRLIQSFLNSKGLTSKEVSNITGASNPYSEIESLRKIGWIIFNTKHSAYDRDNKKRHFDRYHLSHEQYIYARQVIECLDVFRPRHENS